MPIGLLSIEQWAAIDAAIVPLVDFARWPRGRRSWSTHRSRGSRRSRPKKAGQA
jgi:hypothetical protein